MSVFVLFVLIGSTFLDDAGASDPVRRSSRKQHCVVWGDGPYFGLKFEDEHEADQQFKRVKRSELVAVHYDNRFREVQRHKSPRVKLVRWNRLADWCKEDHKVEEASVLEVGVESTGKVDHIKAESSVFSSPDASLLSQDPHETANEVGLKASSSLVSTVAMIEKEVADLVSKTSSLFASIGQHDWVSGLVGKETDGKLKTRVNSLDLLVSQMFRSTETLEKELLGNVEAGPTKSQSWIEKVSIKSKIESLLPKVDNLKKRIPALASSSVLSVVGKLESKASQIVTQAAAMLKNLGMGRTDAVSAIQTDTSLKARIVSLEEMIASSQHDIKTLEAEVLERSSSAPVASPKTHAPLKIKLESLSALVEDLSGRMSALAASPLQGAVDKLEEKVTLMQSKAMEVSKRVGSEAHLESETTRNYASLKARIPVLGDRVSKAQRKLEALEEELLGTRKSLHASLEDTQSMRGQVTSLEVKVDGLMNRATALEQEV